MGNVVEKSLEKGECIFENLEVVEKFKTAFELLAPDQDGKIHKSKMLEFFQLVLGDIYQEELAKALVEGMGPDEEGMLSLEAFVQKPLTDECIASIEEFLDKNPDIREKISSWREILGKFGLELSDVELTAVVEEAQRGAAKIFNLEMPSIPGKSEDDGIIGCGLVEAIREKMHLLHIGENIGKGADIVNEQQCVEEDGHATRGEGEGSTAVELTLGKKAEDGDAATEGTTAE